MGSRRTFTIITSALTVVLISWLKRNVTSSLFGFIISASLLGIFNLCLVWCFHAYVFPFYISALKDIPIVGGYSPIVGHAFQDWGEDKNEGDHLKVWVEEGNGRVVRFLDLSHTENLMPVSPNALQELLTTRCYDFEKPGFWKRGTNKAVLGEGLLFAEGNMHKKQRKQLNPAFAFRHVKDLYPTFWALSTSLVRTIEAQRDTETMVAVIEPNDWASRSTLDALGRAGLGRTFDAIQNPDNELTSAYRDLFHLSNLFEILLRLLEFVIPPVLVTSLPIKRNRMTKSHVNLIRGSCQEMIREKQLAQKQAAAMPTNDILGALLSSSEVSFTETEMVEQLLTFLAAGHETTAAALAWAIFACCKYPEMEQRLREEIWANIDGTAWDAGNDVTVSDTDLAKLTYLQAFCNEVLRVWPPVPQTVREAARDTTLDGHFIPKGTQFIIAPWATNTAKALWGPDAADFRPERWLESPTGGCKSNYANTTFLAGPRSCIGSGFAKGEFQCLVTAWVGRFETRFAKDGENWKEPRVSFIGGISAKPKPGWKVKVKSVERPSTA